MESLHSLDNEETTRCPISIIRPNRSSRFCDWCEVSPCLFSSSRMSSMILFSVSVSRYGSGNAVSGSRARGFFRRSSSMMVWRSCLVQRPFCSNSSTIAAISHIFEIVASSMVMVSRLGRSVAHGMLSKDSCTRCQRYCSISSRDSSSITSVSTPYSSPRTHRTIPAAM